MSPFTMLYSGVGVSLFLWGVFYIDPFHVYLATTLTVGLTLIGHLSSDSHEQLCDFPSFVIHGLTLFPQI